MNPQFPTYLTLPQLATHHAVMAHPKRLWNRQILTFALLVYRDILARFNPTDNPNQTIRIFELNGRPQSMCHKFVREFARLCPIPVEYITLIPPAQTAEGEFVSTAFMQHALRDELPDGSLEDTVAEVDEKKLVASLTERWHHLLENPFDSSRLNREFHESKFDYILVPDLAFSFGSTKTMIAAFSNVATLLTPLGKLFWCSSLPLDSDTPSINDRHVVNHYMRHRSGEFSAMPTDSIAIYQQDEDTFYRVRGNLAFSYAPDTAQLQCTYTNVELTTNTTSEGKKGKIKEVVTAQNNIEPFSVDMFVPAPEMITVLPTTLGLNAGLTYTGRYFFPTAKDVKLASNAVFPFAANPQIAPIPQDAEYSAYIMEFGYVSEPTLQLVTPSDTVNAAQALVAESELSDSLAYPEGGESEIEEDEANDDGEEMEGIDDSEE